MPKYERIDGCLVAPFTPFHKDGSVNLSMVKPYAELLKRNGIIGVFINGSSGEGYMLTQEERVQLAEEWIKYQAPEFKVIVHAGATCVKQCQFLAEHAQRIGAFGVATMASPFPKAGNVEQLVQYCEAIASHAPKLPFYFYHIPALSGVSLPMLPFLKAVDGRIPNFAGIKYTFENMYEFNQCTLYGDHKFDMLHGQDETLLPSLALSNTRGAISGTGSYVGSTYVAIRDAWDANDIVKARELQNFAQDVINVICMWRGNIVCGKRIMKLMGLDMGDNRIPFQTVSEEEEKKLVEELKKIGFFERCNK